MARYFFHVINSEFIPDEEGLDCGSDDEVKTEAVRIAGAMIEDQGLKIWDTKRFDLFVCDDKNRTRLKLSITVEEVRALSGT